MNYTSFIPGLCIWLIVLAFLFYRGWSAASSGLVLAYGFQLWMLHWLGGFIHALPWANLPDSEIVLLGFQQSTYGVVAFAVGTLLLGGRLSKFIAARSKLSTGVDFTLPRTYIIFGIVSYFLLGPTLGRIPGLMFIWAIGSQFVIIGCCLACWRAWHEHGKVGLLRTAAPALLIPVVTIVAQGFLGYGIIAISIITFFCAHFFRPRWLLILGFLVAGYVGLSFYATYMRDRVMIRASVWGGDSLKQRWDVVSRMFGNMDAFSPTNQEQLSFIDARLNQNVFIGTAVTYLSRPGDFAHGETLWDAVLGLVPRILWPSKPVSAGSTNLVLRFTGISFAPGTSVGVGQVLEFYANFGTLGVVVGFFILGGIIKALDLAAGTFLVMGQWLPFTTCFLVGISFLNVGGSLVEISMGAISSLVIASIVNKFLHSRSPSLPGKQYAAVGRVVDSRM